MALPGPIGRMACGSLATRSRGDEISVAKDICDCYVLLLCNIVFLFVPSPDPDSCDIVVSACVNALVLSIFSWAVFQRSR